MDSKFKDQFQENLDYIKDVCSFLNESENIENPAKGLEKIAEAAKYNNQISFNKTKSYLAANIEAKIFSFIKNYVEYNSLSPANKLKKDIEKFENYISESEETDGSDKKLCKERKKLEKLKKKFEKINNKEGEEAKKREKELAEIEEEEKNLKQKLWDYSRHKIELTENEIQTIGKNLATLNNRYAKIKSYELSDNYNRKQEIRENVKNAWETYDHLNELGSADYFLENGFDQDRIKQNEKFAIVSLGKETSENIAKSIALTEYVLLGSGYEFRLEDRIIKVNEEDKTNFCILSEKRIKNMLDEISEDIQLEEKEAKKLIEFGKLCDYINDLNLASTLKSPRILKKEMVVFFKTELDNLIERVDEKTKNLVNPEL